MEEINNQESDAQILWDDAVSMLEDEGLAPAVLAMLRSCTATDLTEDTLVIAAGGAFVKRNVEKNTGTITEALGRAAFQPMKLKVELSRQNVAGAGPATTAPATTITADELERMRNATAAATAATTQPKAGDDAEQRRRRTNPLVEKITAEDSRLTFDTFVEGEENQLAFQAAKAVADGSTGYNPLFIYGRSGLGKTHLLKAIQNYLATYSPERVCVYRQARDFVRDYTGAMNDSSRNVREALADNYHDIDVLIIDDIQGFGGAVKSIDFFFDTFNYLTSHGKQIVLAADESPAELGLEDRVATRLDSGVTIAIQVPNYELKYGLVKAFCERMKEEAANNPGMQGFTGAISQENLEFMAQRSGSSIRTIKAFCQSCLLTATKKQEAGGELTREDINALAIAKWGAEQRTFTIDQIQKFVEQRYGISHADLISNKRNKGLMEPRHVAVWLTRELTDSTLGKIGEKFGGRTHATVKHSLKWVEERRDEDRIARDKIDRLKEDLMASS